MPRVATRLTFRQYIDIPDDEQYHNIPVKNIVTFSVQLKFPSPIKLGLVSYSKLHVTYKTCNLQFWKFPIPTLDYYEYIY